MRMTAGLYIKPPRGERVCVCLKADSFILILLLYYRSVDMWKFILLSIHVSPIS